MSMPQSGDFRALPNSPQGRCFACGPLNPAGLQMRFFTDERSVFSRLVVPEHLCGWNEVVHGGVLSIILDEIMSWAVIYLLKSFTLTRSMSIDFLKPIKVGSSVQAEGRLGKMRGKREAAMEGFVYDGNGQLCVRSSGIFKVIPPHIARRMGIADESSWQWFEHLADLPDENSA